MPSEHAAILNEFEQILESLDLGQFKQAEQQILQYVSPTKHKGIGPSAFVRDLLRDSWQSPLNRLKYLQRITATSTLALTLVQH